MSKLSLLLQVDSWIYNSRWEKKTSTVDWMKTVAGERCNIHTLYHYVKGIVPKIIIYNNRIPHYDAPKKNDTEQTSTKQWPNETIQYFSIGLIQHR